MRPIVIAAGGTGGHFFPAEALAAALIARGYRVVLMTDGRSGAMRSAVFSGLEQHVLKGAGLSGRGAWRGAAALLSMTAGIWQARHILKRMNAAAIIGFGGYPSVAPILAARLTRPRPVMILHEQNAVLGRANRMLARFADRLATGFATTSRMPAAIATIVTGNPVRPAIQALAGEGYAPPVSEFRLLVLGGSLGARIFSDVIPAAIAQLPPDMRARLRIAQQCRQDDIAGVRAAYDRMDANAELAAFFDDVATRLTGAHLVIARAGASTCAEIAVAGRPSILVPLPGAIDDHQRANAEQLAAGGGATLCLQPAFSASWLAASLRESLANPEALARSAARVAVCGKADAASDLADLVEHLVANARAPA